jgi:signal transduction histidine kinase/putative methionine-R-sulfoxide reductase with GAF domain
MLFLQEQHRARHLSLVNEVQKCALLVRDNATFLHQATRAIHSHFSNSSVSVLLSDTITKLNFDGLPPQSGSNLILAAQAGEKQNSAASGDTRADHLIAARAVQTQRAQHLEPSDYSAIKSGFCVPIVANGRALGAICLESRSPDAFTARDTAALQTVTAIIASHLEAGRMYDEMRELGDFNKTLIESMLHSLMAVDSNGVITLVNARLCQTLGLTRQELITQPIERVFGSGRQRTADLRHAITDVASTGTPYELPEIPLDAPAGRQVFDVRMFRIYFRGEAQTILLLINVTRRWRMLRQMELVNEIGRLFGASLDINKVLHTVLTCVTAGAGLGFNRAFLLLREADTTLGQTLRGTMALGPSSHEEAALIWREMGNQELTLEQILEQSDVLDTQNPTPLQQQVLQLELALDNPCFPILETVIEQRRALCIKRRELIGAMDETLGTVCGDQLEKARSLFTAPEIAIAPLLAKDRVVGVIFADNLYSGAPIETDDIQLLDALSQQAGLTIANALAYQALQLAQRELVGAERLAAVGEMAARVSHEIRNPLATVGGFARSIAKKPDNADEVRRKSAIIVDEVERLEDLLNDLLEMAKPRLLDLKPHSINAIVEHALLLAESEITAHLVHVEKELDKSLPFILCDRARVLQAVLNIIRNGAQAMPDGGTLRVQTKRSENGEYFQVIVQDSGTGITGQALKHVFDPFFSTKLKGSGLGLAITRRILRDHGGEIDVHSEPGQGTIFILNWPWRLPDETFVSEEK